MMVMYDMYNSLKAVEEADSNIHELMELQLQVAEDTSCYKKTIKSPWRQDKRRPRQHSPSRPLTPTIRVFCKKYNIVPPANY